jgi:hypothetical protein
MAALLALAVLSAAPEAHHTLTAPTFYIAASAQFDEYSPTVTVKGASNLPVGSRLSAVLYDYIGYLGSPLSEERFIKLPKNGLFEIVLKPLPEKKFKHNMVCDVGFFPAAPGSDVSVLAIVGKRGEQLGIDTNPQIGKNSGAYYLDTLIDVP